MPSSSFTPKFSRIAPPRQGDKNYDDKVRTSLVAEFNRVQRESERGTCGPTAASEWLKKHRPKVALHPSMTDYCNTCKNLKEEQCRVQAIINRLNQSGSAAEADLRAQEDHRMKLEEESRQKTPLSRGIFTESVWTNVDRTGVTSCALPTDDHWSTYYLQKVSHDIFGIVDHRDEKGTLYLFDERIGPKNTDHTLSFLSTYWQSVSHRYSS